MLAYVVMDDHVHVLVEPMTQPLESIVHSWKSFTTHALQRRGRRGRIWQPEYFDRIMRGAREAREKLEYIVNNPAKRWPGGGAYPWVWFDPQVFS